MERSNWNLEQNKYKVFTKTNVKTVKFLICFVNGVSVQKNRVL